MPQQNKSSQHISKRLKPSRSHGFQYPPTFWDNLSNIDLTRYALRELDRRNAQVALDSRPLHLGSLRPVTRRSLPVLRQSSPPLLPAVEYLRYCRTRTIKNIQQSAKHGSLDLSDLRSVSRLHIAAFSTDQLPVSRTSKHSD